MPDRTILNTDSPQTAAAKTFDPSNSVSGGLLVSVTLDQCGAGDPTTPLGVVSKQYVDALLVFEYATGDVKPTLKTVADAGWVLMLDNTIGNAASGATGRANADTLDLFTLLWDNVLDAWAPVSGGRGASAAADFAADKTIKLTHVLGRALALFGAGAGLTPSVMGEALGAEDHILTSAELSFPGDSAIQGSDAGGGRGLMNYFGAQNHNHSLSYGLLTLMQPTSFFYFMVRL